MEKSISEVLDQNRRIIEQNRILQEQLNNLSEHLKSLEQKIEFSNAVSIVSNRSVSILSSSENLFDEEDQEEASQTVKSWKEKEDKNLIQLIDLSRAKYI